MTEIMSMVSTYLVLVIFVNYCVNEHKEGRRIL